MATDLDKLLGRNDNSKMPSAKEVSQLIKIAKECGVETLEFGELRVKFKLTSDKEVVAYQPEAISSPGIPMPSVNQSSPEEARQLLEDEAIIRREAELDELKILHPEKYEALITQGELRNETEDDFGVEQGIQ